MSLIRPPLAALGLLFAGTLLFTAGNAHWALRPVEGHSFNATIRTVPPPPVAVAMAFGDRYLAADLATIHAFVAADDLTRDAQKAQLARLLSVSIELNPAHEDAYYLMEAMLPWQGRVDQAQRLLRKAEKARPWDWMPPFFRAFNRYYFFREPIAGAQILQKVAERSSPKRAAQLRAVAGRWSALGHSPERALELVQAMTKGVPAGPLRRNLDQRAAQLRGLIQLREANRAFQRQKEHPPPDLEALVGFAGLKGIPQDPTGEGFILDEEGRVRVRPPNFEKVQTPRGPGRAGEGKE